MNTNFHYRAGVLLASLVSCLGASIANAALTVMDTKYHPDLMFPEFNCYWDGGQYPTVCPPQFLGATVYVYLKNTGASSATISDANLGVHSLNTVIKRSTASWNPNDLNSIYFNWDVPPSDILDAGEPVWWKANPTTVPVGGVAQVAVRLRYVPTTATVSVGVVSSAGTVTTNITVDVNAPQIQSIGYSEDRTKVYLHWRRSGGAAPASVWLDGTNVTSLTTTVSDPNLNLAASVINLTNALGHFSFHVYQGIYADGKSATAGQRAWTNKFIYATYGTFEFTGSYDGPEWVAEASDHGFNNVQMNLGGMGNYMGTSAGRADMLAHGYGYTILDPGKLNPIDPDMWFLNDEPELIEYNNYQNNCGIGFRIPCDEKKFPGTLAMFESVEHAADVLSHRPNVPTTVNLDGGLQPQSFYNWGPSVDILQTDNYYEPRMRNAYEVDFNKIPLYNNSRFSHAIGRTITAAAEPNPGNHLLYSTAKAGWPYPAWQSKRFEVYYTLAGGTKGIGYWWLQGGYGMNNSDPDSQLLWKEVGLCGNEIKTARDLIVRSTPIAVTITQTPKVWAKAVASGTDSMIVYVVNDNYVNAANGLCYVTNVANASVTVTLPSWMLAPMAFEITAGGLKPVSMQATNGNQLQINLGTLTLTRMIVLTKNAQLPLTTLQRYNQSVRPGVCNMAPAYCTNSAPAIVVPPQSQTVILGENAPFTVTASGIPLPAHQWRFNGTNLAGATDASFTRSNAQAGHAGGYSVVVSNSLGSVTSVVATLTVSTNGIAPGIFIPPQSQSVEKGQNATFNVTASGTEPLSYQWRFNGGSLAGATGTSYTRFNAQTNDTGSYAVIVTNSAGAITSAPATLTVTVPIFCNPVSLVNGGFEGGNSGGVATGWTAYEVNSPTIKVWSIQTASPSEGLQYQQIQAYNAAHTANAGVRQDVTGCVIGATYQISGWYRSNSDFGRARVRVSPTASTDWSTAIDLNPVADYGSGATWAAFSGTVVASGTTMTLWLDGRTISGTSGKVGCFDAVTVACLGPTAPPVLEFKQQGTDLVFRWATNHGNYGLIATTNLGAVWSGVLPSPTVVNGTNVVTNAISGERKFYRLMRP